MKKGGSVVIRFDCDCGREFVVSEEQVGKKGKCPVCGKVNVVPPSARVLETLSITQEPSQPSLMVKQIESLKRSNRTLFLIALAGPFLAVLTMLGIDRLTRVESKVIDSIGPSTKIIEAQGLVIKDDKGRIRASLEYEGEREVSLKMFDGNELRTEHRIWANGIPSTIFYQSGTGQNQACSIGGGGSSPGRIEFYDKLGMKEPRSVWMTMERHISL